MDCANGAEGCATKISIAELWSLWPLGDRKPRFSRKPEVKQENKTDSQVKPEQMLRGVQMEDRLVSPDGTKQL